MSKNLNEILQVTREILPYIKEKYHVNTLEVFGSYTRNEQKSGSDLDVLVTFTQTPTLLKFIELEDFLSNNMNIKIDLVMKESLKPALKNRILKEAISV